MGTLPACKLQYRAPGAPDKRGGADGATRRLARPRLDKMYITRYISRFGAPRMSHGLKKLPAAFYETPGGSEPVREWFKGLPKEDRKIIGYDIALVEYGWPVSMPLCRPLGDGLWEVRSNLTGGRIGRVIFCVTGMHMVLLHGFVKKTQRTPDDDRRRALKRMREVK